MKKKNVTIKEVAKLAQVSIATVSHVINRTRYVRPELIEKVENVIKETGYIKKISEKKLKIGGKSTVVAIIPDIESATYRNMVVYLRKLVTERGCQFMICISNDDIEEEKSIVDNIVIDKRTLGVLLVPVSDSVQEYSKLLKAKIPFVCIGRSVYGEGIDNIEFKNKEGIYKGTKYLIECGHKKIIFFREAVESSARYESTKGYTEAIRESRINMSDSEIIDIDLYNENDRNDFLIQRAINRVRPTAIITNGNRLTLLLVKVLKNMGIECPGDISVVGYGDDIWCELTTPPLTTLERDVLGISTMAIDRLFGKINSNNMKHGIDYAEVEFKIRESTKMVDNGPFGEEAVSPDEIVISPEEKKQLKMGKYRVAISFHYTGTAWATLHEKGIRDGLALYGIDVVAVTDAHFDSKLQIMQLEGIAIQKPDAVIAVPTDDKETAEKFSELSEMTRLIFISNVPELIKREKYISCVSVNEWENGTNIGRMIGEYFKGKEKIKVGFITHGAAFYGTRARDTAAEKVVLEYYGNIEIAIKKAFKKIENTYQICKEMVLECPDMDALYISWDQPALLALRALKEMNREDIMVFTSDLDHEIAAYMEKGYVKGLSTQKPYEQGLAAALVVAKSLVCDNVPKYVGVQPYIVYPKQLRRAWKDVMHEQLPSDIPNKKFT